MDDKLKTSIDLQKAINEAEQELTNIDTSPFSLSAFDFLKTKIGEYIAQLISESIKISKRHQADTVSANHVQRASEYLFASTSKRIFRHLGTVGGILLGASLSNLLSMTGTGQYTTPGILISSGLGIIGSFLIAIHIAKD